ncbi:hypothetical protein F5Y18DRAFT_297244 [Xylariaceae sp. FL1019]|nr:hypothetical protein F5Y18DRAFT_297244 [Xylariaceae sp. FL1019]
MRLKVLLLEILQSTTARRPYICIFRVLYLAETGRTGEQTHLVWQLRMPVAYHSTALTNDATPLTSMTISAASLVKAHGRKCMARCPEIVNVAAVVGQSGTQGVRDGSVKACM